MSSGSPQAEHPQQQEQQEQQQAQQAQQAQQEQQEQLQQQQQQQQPQQHQQSLGNEPQGLISISLKEPSPKADATQPVHQEPVNGSGGGDGGDDDGGVGGDYSDPHQEGTEKNDSGEWHQVGSTNDVNGYGQDYQHQYGYSSYHGANEESRATQSSYIHSAQEDEEGALPTSNEYDPTSEYYDQYQGTWGGSDAGPGRFPEPREDEGTRVSSATNDPLEYGTLFEPFQKAEEQRREDSVARMGNQANFDMEEGDVTTSLERRTYDSWRPGGGKAKAGQSAPTKKVSVEKQELIEKRLSMERPCRSLFIRNIGYSTTDEIIRELYSAYGDLQNFHTLLDRRGMAFITYFDLRDAENAKASTHGQLVDGRALDVHYSLPKQDFSRSERVRKEHNQGTLRIRLSNTDEPEPQEREISHFFAPYGDIKSARRAGGERSWLIEFYDSRACVRAYNEAHGLRVGSAAISTELEWDADDRVPDREEHLAFTSSLRRRSRSPQPDRRVKDEKLRVEKPRVEKSNVRSRSRERERGSETRRDQDPQKSRAGRSHSRSQSRERERERERDRERDRERERERERERARSRSPARNKNFEDRSTKSFPWENNYRPRENREHRDDGRRPYVTYRGFRPNRQAYELEWPQHILDMQPMPMRKRQDSSLSRDESPRRPSLQSRGSPPPAAMALPPPPPPPPPMPTLPTPVAPSAVPAITPQQAAALLQGYNPLLANSIMQQQLQMEQKAQQQIMSLLTELTSNRMAAPTVPTYMPAMSSQQPPQNFAAPISQAGRAAPVKDPRLGGSTNNNTYSPPEVPRPPLSAAPVNMFSQLSAASVAPPGVNLGAAGPDSQVQQLMKLLSQAQGQNTLGGLGIPGMNASIAGSTGFGMTPLGGVSGSMMGHATPAAAAAGGGGGGGGGGMSSPSGYNPNNAFIERDRGAGGAGAHGFQRAPLPSQHDTMISENALSDQQRAYLVGREHRGGSGNSYHPEASPSSSSLSSRLDWSPPPRGGNAFSSSTYDEYGATGGKRQRAGEENDHGRSNVSNAKYARTEDYSRGGGGGAGTGGGGGGGGGSGSNSAAGGGGSEPYVERDTYGNEQIFTSHGQQRRGGYERQDDRADYDYGDRNDFRRDRGDVRGGYRGRGRYQRP